MNSIYTIFLSRMKKKILTWINADLLQFGVIKSIQSKIDCSTYAIIDVTNKPKEFFKEQKLVKFEKFWFLHENIDGKLTNHNIDYLTEVEKKYGINLLQLAMNDRIFFNFNNFYKFSSEQILSIIEQECKFFEKILDDTNPDYVIMDYPALRPNYLFYLICKARKITTLKITPTRLGKKFYIDNGKNHFSATKNLSSNKYELENYHKRFDNYDVTIQFRKRFAKSKSKLLEAFIEYIFSKNDNIFTHYTYFGRGKLRVISNYIKFSIKSKNRKNFLDKNFLKVLPKNQKFIFFPLHIEQERSTLIDAPFQVDQLHIIKQIVKSLPIGYKLYVKEHPSMSAREWRELSFYKTLLSLPNVVGIHPSVNPDGILEHCSLVITINGTAGFEVAFYQKPTITLTETDYSAMESVTTLDSLDKLPNAIQKCLESKVNVDALNSYIDFVENTAFELDLDSLNQDNQDFLHYGGFLVDVNINEKEFEKFLKSKQSEYDLIANEYIKNIK